MTDEVLYWHCLHCGDHEPVEPTGGAEEYVLGDKERCITCGDGTAHVPASIYSRVPFANEGVPSTESAYKFDPKAGLEVVLVAEDELDGDA